MTRRTGTSYGGRLGGSRLAGAAWQDGGMAHDLVIGTYTERLPHVDGRAEGVLAARFGGTEVAAVAVAARVANPSWVAVTPDGSRVYAVSETGPDGGVVAYARTPDGTLTGLGSASSGG